ncbi:Hypothetical protein DEACI_1088 [Acididesulfobacillus acetoxydans]|uniref:Uncharacterized protein n=1 Tax=Acididesulfobacillus acetoxydans TaxID=1561005 RepID=A0A8S0Y278_9FIRM|nr:hypothetical protein [Acididesulfobacillus acetoxydans]CAA7600435.1 Hypothetical protein DEACI_1088 [Acididesulfobacillus acetoxydans]CEJ06569.1 Hypothetical protein DEACI_1018 [Acididesulfobacillus acetoxydans]
MSLIDDIRFTREKLDTLHRLGVTYTRFGPGACFVVRGFFRVLRATSLGRRWDQWIADGSQRFKREFIRLQRVCPVPPRFWDDSVLSRFESYALSERAVTLEDCIRLYNSEVLNDKNCGNSLKT